MDNKLNPNDDTLDIKQYKEDCNKHTSDPVFDRLDSKANERVDAYVWDHLPLTEQQKKELYFDLMFEQEKKIRNEYEEYRNKKIVLEQITEEEEEEKDYSGGDTVTNDENVECKGDGECKEL